MNDSRGWLLVETLSDTPTVIAEGNRQRQLRPLGNVLRGKVFEAVSDIIAEARTTREPLCRDLSTAKSDGAATLLVAHPISAPCGHVFGVQVYIGDHNHRVTPPHRVAAWEWRTNSTGAPMSTVFTSDFRELYGIVDARPADTQFGLADLYRRIPRMSDVAAVMDGVDSASAGDVRTGNLIARHDNGQRRLIRYVRRAVPQDNGVSLRGIDHDVTAPGQERLLEIETADADIAARIARSSGSYSAVLEVRSGSVIRWVSGPIPGLPLDVRGGAVPLLATAAMPLGEPTIVTTGSPPRPYRAQTLESFSLGSSQAALLTFTPLDN